MARLKKLKFEDVEDMLEYYENNKNEIFSRTYKLLREFWDKNKFIDTVNIYETQVKNFDNMKYISVMKEEWSHCLNEIQEHYVNTEQYEEAVYLRDFLKLLFGEPKLN